MYMKKFYSIIGLLVLSATFAQKVSAQDPPCIGAGANILEDNTINYCRVEFLTTNASLFGANIQVYAGNDNVTVGTVNVNLAGRATIPYTCGNLNKITLIELKINGNICLVDVGQRIVLPIVLGGFNATLKGNSVVLNWNTELESLSSHFEVEKSADGKTFATLGNVKAAGISNSVLNYSFTDNSFGGTGFYRLKLVDLDGKFKYSKVIYANGGSGALASTLSVFPNPFRSDVQLKGINASDVNKNNIRIFNATGKAVAFKVTGSNSIAIDASVPKGVYILKVNGSNYKLLKD
jgi:type IX secretion system substrate protein